MKEEKGNSVPLLMNCTELCHVSCNILIHHQSANDNESIYCVYIVLNLHKYISDLQLPGVDDSKLLSLNRGNNKDQGSILIQLWAHIYLESYSYFWWYKYLITRGVTIRWATIRYISQYNTHDTVHDMIQNQLIYYQWKILKRCGMCHQYYYIKTVILVTKSEFEINKVVYNHPCSRYLLLTNCVYMQGNKIS